MMDWPIQSQDVRQKDETIAKVPSDLKCYEWCYDYYYKDSSWEGRPKTVVRGRYTFAAISSRASGGVHRTRASGPRAFRSWLLVAK